MGEGSAMGSLGLRRHVQFGLRYSHRIVLSHRAPTRGPVPTEAPTIMLANRNRSVVQPTGPLAIGPVYSSPYVMLHCLVNGPPHWTRSYLVRQ
jgi:hypothetical protein